MKIGLICDDFFPSKGGIANVSLNICVKSRMIGEEVVVFNNSYENPKFNCIKNIHSQETLKSIFFQPRTFYIFIIYLFWKILLTFKSIPFKVRVKFAMYYCFYPKFIVNRINSIKNLRNSFKKENIDVIICGALHIRLFMDLLYLNYFKFLY